MKISLISLTAVLAFAFPALAVDTSVKLTDVHVCCKACVKGVQTATAKVEGLKASADETEGTVSLSAADKATVQKGVDALVAAGYFGKSSDPSIKLHTETGAKDQTVQTLNVEGVHLCCGQCVKAVNRVLESVPGVKANTAAKDAKTFTVTGDFNDKAVFTALQKEGLTGKVATAK